MSIFHFPYSSLSFLSKSSASSSQLMSPLRQCFLNINFYYCRSPKKSFSQNLCYCKYLSKSIAYCCSDMGILIYLIIYSYICFVKVVFVKISDDSFRTLYPAVTHFVHQFPSTPLLFFFQFATI